MDLSSRARNEGVGGKGEGLPPPQDSAPVSLGSHNINKTENFRKNRFGSGGLEAEVNWRSNSGGGAEGVTSERICFNPQQGEAQTRAEGAGL